MSALALFGSRMEKRVAGLEAARMDIDRLARAVRPPACRWFPWRGTARAAACVPSVCSPCRRRSGHYDRDLLCASREPRGRACDLVCAISETIASTNSPDERRQLRQFLRAGRGVYQIWNGVDASWGPNLCDVAACSLSSGLLQLENRYSTDEGGRRITHEEMRTIDLSSGHTTSRMVDSTTELPTAYEVETTTYDTGTCAPSADPAAGGGKGSR